MVILVFLLRDAYNISPCVCHSSAVTVSELLNGSDWFFEQRLLFACIALCGDSCPSKNKYAFLRKDRNLTLNFEFYVSLYFLKIWSL